MTTWWCDHALVGDGVQHDVTIETDDGVIVAVSTDTTRPRDANHLAGLTVPGFANAHSHAFHRALRSRVQSDRGTFWTWRDTMYRAASKLNPDNYHRLARAVFAEMALTGITCVGEFHYVHHQPDGAPYSAPNPMGEALLAAAADAGIRITLLDTMYTHGGLDHHGYTELTGAQKRFGTSTIEAAVERVESLHLERGQRSGAAIHSVRAVEPAEMADLASWARDNDKPLHAHVSEQRAENEMVAARWACTPTELIESTGALTANFTAVHATHLTDHDIELLGSARAHVCLCPTTERDLGDGIGPSARLADAGVSICVGSDSHAVIDQMLEVRAVEMHARLRDEQRGLHSATELLGMATVNGHASLGWDDAGALRQGHRADLVTFRLDSPRTAGTSTDSLAETAVFASTASDIHSVVVDGRPIVSAGEHRSIDSARELTRTIEELMT